MNHVFANPDAKIPRLGSISGFSFVLHPGGSWRHVAFHFGARQHALVSEISRSADVGPHVPAG